MEFVILRNQEVIFQRRRPENDGLITMSSDYIKAGIYPTNDEDSDNEVYFDYLTEAVIERPWTAKNISDHNINWDIKIAISVPNHVYSLAGDQPAGKLKIFSSNNSLEDSFLKSLHEMFIKNTEKLDDKDNILLNVIVKDSSFIPEHMTNEYGHFAFKATGLQLSEHGDAEGFSFTDKQLVLPEKMFTGWSHGYDFRGTFTISLVLSNSCLSMLYNISLLPNERFSHLKKVLDDETCTDTEIFVGAQPKQVVVKCHRLMLVASSEVFQSMFESGMKEAKENKITIPEMSEKGVRAMLAFLYYREMKDVYEDVEVALELLQAAEKYGIDDLKNEVRLLFLARQSSWFTVDAALELLLFVDKLCRNFEGEVGTEKNEKLESAVEEIPDGTTIDYWESLKRKAVMVLKWYAKWKPKSVMESEKYQEIFMENPKLGMEVGLCFLEV